MTSRHDSMTRAVRIPQLVSGLDEDINLPLSIAGDRRIALGSPGPTRRGEAMPEFVAPPRPKNERIPIITVQDLVDALSFYLSSLNGYKHHSVSIESDRSTLVTDIFLTGQPSSIDNKPKNYRIQIFERAVQNTNSRLWNTPFDVHLWGDGLESAYRLVIEPRPDRSISIKRILRWEHGLPICEV
jgi:hypothetical protein